MAGFNLFAFTGGVWRTDGTASGTFLLLPGGSFGSEFAYGGQVIFSGQSHSARDYLFVSDGTTAGTHQLPPTGGWSGQLGVNAEIIGIIRGHVLFNGLDRFGKQGLWSTDGTTGGTHQVMVAGAAEDFPIGSVSSLYKGKFYFTAPDTSGNYQLWSTNGTAKGTVEIPVPGARTNGGIDPSGFYSELNGKLLFTGQVSNIGMDYALFASDGTTAGTVKLTDNFDEGFVTLGRKSLFSTWSLDRSKDGLWITDGTPAGTRELDVTGLSTSTTYPNEYVYDLTGLDGQAYFSAGDPSGNRGLWRSDGTARNTAELQSPLFSANLVPSDFKVLDNKLLFTGEDAAGRAALFSLDGTSGAVSEIIEAPNSGLFGADPHSTVIIETVVNGAAVVQLSSGRNGGDEISLILTDGSTTTTLSDVIYGTAVYVDGSEGKETIVGTGSRNFVSTINAYGTGLVVVDLKDGNASKGGNTDATLINFQGVQLGSDQSVILGLTSGVDYFYGGAGSDSFYNEGAHDVIHGGPGASGVVGGAGATTFYGDSGYDHIYASTGSMTVYGKSGTEDLTAASGSTRLLGSTSFAGTDILRAGSGTAVFFGGIGTALLYEGSGADTFHSDGGMDYIYGGSGSSHVVGGAGTDVVTTGSGNQQVTAGTGHTYFNDVASHLTAGRLDRIGNFAGGAGTDIYLPTTVQGSTTFRAQNGGTAVLTTVSGGTAEIFTPSTDLATVQSHTHFTLSG